MFCPDCKAEYRPGFTRCSDCGLDLVEHLEQTNIHSNNPELSDTPELLWTGTDAATRDAIIDALETAEIPYHERGDNVGSLPGWSRQVYAIFTHATTTRLAWHWKLRPAVGKRRPRIQTKRSGIRMRRCRTRRQTTTRMTCPMSRPITSPRILIQTKRPPKSGPARTLLPETT